MAKGLTRPPALIGAALLLALVALYLWVPPVWTFSLSPSPAQLLQFRLEELDRTIDSTELAQGGAQRLFALGRRAPGFAVVRYRDSVPGPVSGKLGAMYDSGWAHLPVRAVGESILVRIGGPWPDWQTIGSRPPGQGLCVGRGWAPRDTTRPLDSIPVISLDHGSCAYELELGAPGPAIGRWFSRSPIAVWTEGPRSGGNPGRYDWVLVQRRNWEAGGWALRASRSDLPPPYYSIAIAGCAAGRRATCEQAALLPRPTEVHVTNFAEGVGNPLGGLAATLLPAMIRDFGTARFATFWRSNAEVPAAFQAAFGVTLGEWMEKEVLEYFGPLETGAGAPMRTLPLLLVWTLIFLGLAALLARRLRI